MLEDIAGQVAVVTGATRGIGRASALAFAKEGVNVVVTARSEGELLTLVDECESLGVKAIAVSGNAVETTHVDKVKQTALDRFGQVDILLNNVGVGQYTDVVDTSLADYDWIMDTNVRSTFLFTRAFIPEMIERKSGTVLFVSSQAGIAGFPGEAVYCASKHAQVGFARALEYVFGYTAANDVSARDIQLGDGQWIRGKSLDTFCPLGPMLVTADEIPDPQALSIKCTLNGMVVQDSSTSEMIFSVATLISFCSQAFTLEAGDVLLTGTPHGVGLSREPKLYMGNEDKVIVEIESIGKLMNTCIVE